MMTEIRIVRVSLASATLKFRVQYRRWFWWTDLRVLRSDVSETGCTTIEWFDTIEEARAHVIQRFSGAPAQEVIQWFTEC